MNGIKVTQNVPKNMKGLITEAEFMEKLKAERATYQAMFQKVNRVGIETDCARLRHSNR